MRTFLLALSAMILVAIFVFGCGTNTLQSVSGGKVLTSHPNQYFTALNGDVVPRNGSGVPTTLAGSLGSSVYKWLKLWAESGYWKAGDLKMHHTYNGTVGCGQGWMLADGDIINEANYDAEHSAGDWDTYVASSPLDGKYLPNMTGKYPVGVASTTQAGTVAITAVGNSSHQINLAHSHTVTSHTHSMSHNHVWYRDKVAANDQTYDTNGSPGTVPVAVDGGQGIEASAGAGHLGSGGGDLYTSSSLILGGGGTAMGQTGASAPGMDSQLSSTQSIQPHSIEVQYCMRVID